jgi:two-component system OmpR family sensor kinase
VRWGWVALLVSMSSIAAWVAHRGCRARGRHRIAAQAHAEAADQRRRFLRRLDHELKNPLTAIEIGLANLAASPLDEGQRAALCSVQAQIRRMAHFTADLRKLAELETRVIEHVPVDISALLREALALAQEWPSAPDRELTLALPRAASPPPTILGDRDLLFLAVHNLLDNALKFSSPGDAVEVRAFEEDAMWVIEVADTGPGIPEAELPHVWEELYRGPAAQGIPGGGLGLGLVRTIVHRHGGQVTLRSRVGEGTVVTMHLPRE